MWWMDGNFRRGGAVVEGSNLIEQTPVRPVSVAVIADRVTTRDAIVRVLSADTALTVVGQADGPAAGRSLIDLTNPQVVLVNLRLGGDEAPGVTFIRETKARHPQIGVVSLKRRVDEHLLRTALDAGADACCLATTSESRLRSAIKAVAEGATWLDPEISRILLHPVHPVRPSVSSGVGNDEALHLSPRELDILRLVTEGYTNDEIAASLHCSEATIKTHLIHLFRKLGVHDRVSAAVHGLRRGIV